MIVDKKKFVTRVGMILLIIIAVIIVVLFARDGEDKKDSQNTSNNTDAQNLELTKQEFLNKYNEISNNLSQKLLDGSVYDNETLSLAVAKYNKILASSTWTELRLRISY